MSYTGVGVKYIFIILSLLLLTQAGVALSQTPDKQLSKADKTITTINLKKTGDATITIQSQIKLKTQEDEKTFDRIRMNSYEIERNYEKTTKSLVDSTDEKTKQEMEWSNGELKIERIQIPREWGIIRYTFEWKNFASTADKKLKINKTFQNYILSESDTMKLKYPENYTVQNVDLVPLSETKNTVLWQGPIQLSSSGLKMTLIKENLTVNEKSINQTNKSEMSINQTTNQTNVSTTPTDKVLSGSYIKYFLIAIFLLSLATLSIYISFKSEIKETISKIREKYKKIAVSNEPQSDKEKVLKIIGLADTEKIEQKTIQEKTGWSSAKVSQVTKELENEGKIEKLKMGRKNIIRKT